MQAEHSLVHVLLVVLVGTAMSRHFEIVRRGRPVYSARSASSNKLGGAGMGVVNNAEAGCCLPVDIHEWIGRAGQYV